jgi:flagellar basal-body rod modification protein FlgD
MNVNSLLQASGGQGASAASRVEENHNELTRDDFMKLLTKQLTMQSPTEPYDSSQMLQQMSQLSTIDANNNLESTIKDLAKSMSSNQDMQAVQMVGKEVEFFSDKTSRTEGEALKGAVGLPEAATNIKIAITDSDGNVVKEISMANGHKGVNDFSWDGELEDGSQAPAGVYGMSASGTMLGEEVDFPTLGVARVKGVSLNIDTGEGAGLDLGDIGQASMRDIQQIRI